MKLFQSAANENNRFYKASSTNTLLVTTHLAVLVNVRSIWVTVQRFNECSVHTTKHSNETDSIRISWTNKSWISLFNHILLYDIRQDKNPSKTDFYTDVVP